MKFVGHSNLTYEAANRSRGGGQADIFPATDAAGVRVAIKLARRPRPHSEWLDREREHLQTLHTKNPDLRDVVIAVLDHGVQVHDHADGPEETPFLVLPWFEHNLETWLTRPGRTLQAKLQALAPAAAAVARLHWTDQDVRQGVVHRDIKPSNFLLNERDGQLRVVLADFGSARRAHLHQPSTLTGAAAFTAAFAPPEQLLPRRVSPDRSWDVFALGVTVYWGLVGHLPEAVQTTSVPWTPRGQRLATLENIRSTGRGLSRREQAELEVLKDAPLADLLDVRERVSLTDEDRERLVIVFGAAFVGTHLEGEAEALSAQLIDAIEHTLRPDPATRQSDARPLAAALERASRVASRPPPQTFSWLHLGGLHVGAPGFDAGWPGVEEALHDDLARLHARTGPWDAVFVAGDITFSGTATERARAAEVIRALAAKIQALGSQPVYLAVPGARDLVRPEDPHAAVVEVLADWEEKPHIQRRVWNDPESEYRRAIVGASEPFDAWWRALDLSRPVPGARGVLPGDAAVVLAKGDGPTAARVGVVCLNSAALALRPGAPPQGMVLHASQIQAVCQGNAARWAKTNGLNLLLTRHPPERLSPAARAQLDGEIAPPGRFGVHLCGGAGGGAQTLSLGGATARHTWVAPDLVHLGDNDESAGYLAGRATFGDRGVTVRLWPRLRRRRAAGHAEFGPDEGKYSLQEDRGTAPQALKKAANMQPSKAPPKSPEVSPPPPDGPLRIFIPAAPVQTHERPALPPVEAIRPPESLEAPPPEALSPEVGGEVQGREQGVAGSRRWPWLAALGAVLLGITWGMMRNDGKWGDGPGGSAQPAAGAAGSPSTPPANPTAKARPTDGPTGETWTTSAIPDAPMTFIGLSGGTFMMGRPEGESGDDDERPQHKVTVSGFFIGQSEVTKAQWAAVVTAAQAKGDPDAQYLNIKPSYFAGDNLPVEQVSWCQAARFANALSRLEGRTPAYTVGEDCEERGEVAWDHKANGYRLPTEAEWEYAARAGTTTAYATGDTEADLARAGWYDGNSGSKTHAVCTAEVKPWGLCDLHGNVWEWTWDWYGPYQNAEVGNPAGAPRGGGRVLRGGSWGFAPDFARSALRNWDQPSGTRLFAGFRLVLPVVPPEP